MNKIKNILSTFLNWFKSKNLITKVLVVVVLLVSIYFLIPKSKEEAVSYQTQLVSTGSITQMVSETGEIMSTGKSDVISTIIGMVNEVYVDNGTVVTKGQNLFKVFSSATEQERTKAYSSYLTAKNTLDSANRNYLSYESDMWAANSTFIHDAVDLDKAETSTEYIQTNRDWLAAEKRFYDQVDVVNQAKVAVSASWFSYQATIDGIVKAPISGSVANLSIAAGQEVNGVDNALVIASEEKVWVILSVSEADVVDISSGQSAIVSIDALEGKEFEAFVERVDEFGTENSGIITYNAYLVISDPSDQIRPKMTVQVDITTQHKDDVLVVSNSAIKPYQGEKAVQTISGKSGQLIYIPVEVGIKGELNTEIISGVSEGKEIVIGQGNSNSQSDKKSTGLFPIPH